MNPYEIDLIEFMDEFRAEAEEHLRALDAQLLRLEHDPSDPDPIRQMFLSAHTIKGSAAMMGVSAVQVLAHGLEDVLGRLRDGRAVLLSDMADLLFLAVDRLRALVAASQPGTTDIDADTAALVSALERQSGEPLAAHGRGCVVADSGLRALLVEDSATVRMLETMLLTDAGFEVDGVGDGKRALELALQRPYDLIVTGIETRGLRGIDLAATLRGLDGYHSVPIVLMSSDDNAENRRKAAELGIHDYIRKGSLGRHRLHETVREVATAKARQR